MIDSVSIVVIDDNLGSLELLSAALARPGLEIFTASNPVDGIELVKQHRPRLVLTDLVMPGMSGLEVLDHVVAFDPAIDAILMTAHYTTETAVAAIRAGAADYLQKPVKLSLLRERVSALIDSAARRQRAHSGAEMEFEGLVARSDKMWELFAMIERVAPHFRSILIKGPTGAGKDLIAQALHLRGGLKGRFVVLNCSAVVETLFESELFGHVKGAFTGADRDKAGLFDLANGGTLFLDEIGDMPMATQAKLLRAIQNQEVMPVGGLTPKRVNVRIVAATHKDLKSAIAEGKFREDLYYRLAMVELAVPSLRDRPEDIALLARHFMRKFAHEFAKPIDGLTPRATLVLERHSWPGNVRELEHVIGRACMLTEGHLIDVDSLPDHLVQPERLNGAAPDDCGFGTTLTLEEQEKRLVTQAMKEADGNQSEAARRLGIGRDALRYKLKRYDLL
ncbi:two-component system, NtrC family, response regulator HydG [Bryocella elongata]|uniref:Two-component system, NtrC family, response regulator HydG n=1 Tax=Bryocella elongata TaxID=863522 RepID=A0A1H5VXG5_9BACT|nr:sigma-54 dependent transcriptional regulator [Bryocella elongata]SEF91666.1 two-component system, NtrC family, response regulator HydG [Bryocella elongata]